jgi:hypothetical protein
MRKAVVDRDKSHDEMFFCGVMPEQYRAQVAKGGAK